MSDKDFLDKIRTINLSTAPPWAAPLKDLSRNSNDAEANEKIVEESVKLKKQWTSSGKWARWERERKASAMNNKAEWIKRGATPADRDEATKG